MTERPYGTHSTKSLKEIVNNPSPSATPEALANARAELQFRNIRLQKYRNTGDDNPYRHETGHFARGELAAALLVPTASDPVMRYQTRSGHDVTVMIEVDGAYVALSEVPEGNFRCTGEVELRAVLVRIGALNVGAVAGS